MRCLSSKQNGAWYLNYIRLVFLQEINLAIAWWRINIALKDSNSWPTERFDFLQNRRYIKMFHLCAKAWNVHLKTYIYLLSNHVQHASLKLKVMGQGYKVLINQSGLFGCFCQHFHSSISWRHFLFSKPGLSQGNGSSPRTPLSTEQPFCKLSLILMIKHRTVTILSFVTVL